MDSNSESSAATTSTDNRRVIGEGGVSNESGTVNYTSIRNTLDGGAIDGAFGFSKDVFNGAMDGVARNNVAAFNFGSDALGFAGQALDNNGKTTAAAFSFGSDALGFGQDAMGRVSAAGAAALDFGSDALASAFGFGDRTSARAFDFGTDAMAGAFASNDRASARATDFATDALGGAFGFGKTAFAGALNTVDGALASNDSMLARALGYGALITDDALSNLQATQNLTKDAFADAKGRGALTDKMMIVAILAMAGVAFFAVKK